MKVIIPTRSTLYIFEYKQNNVFHKLSLSPISNYTVVTKILSAKRQLFSSLHLRRMLYLPPYACDYLYVHNASRRLHSYGHIFKAPLSARSDYLMPFPRIRARASTFLWGYGVTPRVHIHTHTHRHTHTHTHTHIHARAR